MPHHTAEAGAVQRDEIGTTSLGGLRNQPGTRARADHGTPGRQGFAKPFRYLFDAECLTHLSLSSGAHRPGTRTRPGPDSFPRIQEAASTGRQLCRSIPSNLE